RIAKAGVQEPCELVVACRALRIGTSQVKVPVRILEANCLTDSATSELLNEIFCQACRALRSETQGSGGNQHSERGPRGLDLPCRANRESQRDCCVPGWD